MPGKNRGGKKQGNAPIKLHILSEHGTAEDSEQEFVIDTSDNTLIVRALKQYQPTSEDEAGKRDILLEFFEMP